MKKLVPLFFLLFAFNTIAQTWETVIPFPEPQVGRMFAVDSMHVMGVAVNADSSSFIYSNDAGVHWTFVPIPATPLTVFFTDTMHGWIGLTQGRILKTTDGGHSWDTISINGQAQVSEICFVNDSSGFALGALGANDDTLFITHDGGLTWSRVFLNNINNSQHRRLVFTDELHGWIVDQGNPILYRTIDGGLTWNASPLPFAIGNDSTNTLYFLDSLTGWLTCDNALIKTADGGNNWNYVSPVLAGAIVFRNQLEGVRVDSLLNFYFTNDGGQNWTLTKTIHGYNPSYNFYPRIYFVKNYGYMIYDYQGGTYMSADGINWTTVTRALYPPIYQVQEPHYFEMVSVSNGLFISPDCFGGCVSRTFMVTDSGKTWTEVLFNDTISSGDIVNDSCIFIARYFPFSDSTVFCKSIDQLQTLQTISILNDKILSMHFMDTLNGVCAGNQYLYYTNDGGVTWNPSSGVSGSGYNFSFIDSQRGWVCAPGYLAKTINAGQTWTSTYLDPFHTNSLYKVQFTDPLNGYIMPILSDILLKSTDGGYTFSYQVQTGIGNVRDIHFYDSNNGWLVADSGIFYTNDGLTSLVRQDKHRVKRISFYDGAKGYAMGVKMVLRTNQSNLFTGVKELKNETSFEIFPNPVSNYLTVKSDHKIDRLEIYNLTGELILNELVYSNSFNLEFNISNGIYIVKLISGQTIYNHKIVVISE